MSFPVVLVRGFPKNGFIDSRGVRSLLERVDCAVLVVLYTLFVNVRIDEFEPGSEMFDAQPLGLLQILQTAIPRYSDFRKRPHANEAGQISLEFVERNVQDSQLDAIGERFGNVLVQVKAWDPAAVQSRGVNPGGGRGWINPGPKNPSNPEARGPGIIKNLQFPGSDAVGWD